MVDKITGAAVNGTRLVVADVRPDAPTDDNRVSGQLIHDVLSGRNGVLHFRGLCLKGFYIKGDVDLSFLQWKGQLSLENCHIEGDLKLEQARPTGEINLDGTRLQLLDIRGAVIDGSLLLREGFEATQGILGIAVTVTGAFRLINGKVRAAEDRTSHMAIEIFRAKIGDIFLQHSKIEGGIYAAGVTVDRNFRLYGASFSSRAALGMEHTGADYRGAIVLANAEVKGSIYVWTEEIDKFSAEGLVDLRRASCKELFVNRAALASSEFRLDGLTYTGLSNIEPAEFLDALNAEKQPSPRAYVQLASYCNSVGDLSTRKRTLISLERALTRNVPRWSPLRLARSLHGALVGYGYKPARAILWLVGIVAIAVVTLHFGAPIFALKPAAGQMTGAALALGWSDSMKVVVDSFLPFASLGMKDSWVAVPSTATQWAWMIGFLALRFLAWGLAALALLSFTNIVRNPRS